MHPAERTGTVGSSEPRNADSRPDFGLDAGACGLDTTDDLVAKNQWRAVRRKLPLENVQIGSADAAGANAQQHLSRSGLRRLTLLDFERALRERTAIAQNDRFHTTRFDEDLPLTAQRVIGERKRSPEISLDVVADSV